MVIRNIKAITVSSFLAMFFLGVGTAIIGAAARNIGLSPYEIGLLLAIQNAGLGISVIVSGALADTFAKPRILFIGSVILAISFFTFYLSDSFVLNLCIMLFIGIGLGAYEGVTDPMLLDIHKRRPSLYINLNHFFVTFGALMITLYLVFMQMNWRKSVTESAVAVAGLALLFFLIRLDVRRGPQDTLSHRLGFLLREKAVALLFFAILCAVGVELGVIGIMTTFLMELRDFSQVTSKIGLLVFIGGISTGRLLIGVFIKKSQILNSVLALLACSTLFLALLFLIDAGALTYVIVFITGISVSSTFPLIITLAGLMYREMSGAALGVVKMALPIGGIVIPLFLSIASRYTSLRLSLLLFPLFSLVSFLILFSNRKTFEPRSL
jgi:fucose permease